MQLKRKKEIKVLITGEFPGGPVVKDPPSNAEDTGSISGQGKKSPQAKQPKWGEKKTVITLAYSLIAAVATAESLQSCPTLCDPIDRSLPGSPVPGILQARILEWVAISFSSA